MHIFKKTVMPRLHAVGVVYLSCDCKFALIIVLVVTVSLFMLHDPHGLKSVEIVVMVT